MCGIWLESREGTKTTQHPIANYAFGILVKYIHLFANSIIQQILRHHSAAGTVLSERAGNQGSHGRKKEGQLSVAGQYLNYVLQEELISRGGMSMCKGGRITHDIARCWDRT